jgi:hypothetical protein
MHLTGQRTICLRTPPCAGTSCIVSTLVLAFPNRRPPSGAFLSLIEAYLESLSSNFLQRETPAASIFTPILISLVTWLIHAVFVSIPSTVAPAS